MKVSVSLTEDDLAYLDDYGRRAGSPSRSAVLHEAIAQLRMAELEDAYAEAWDEWQQGDDAPAWDGVTGDGLTDAAR